MIHIITDTGGITTLLRPRKIHLAYFSQSVLHLPVFMQGPLKLQAAQMPAMVLLMTMAALGAPAVHAGMSTAAHATRFDLVSHGMTVGHECLTRTPALRDGKPCLESRLATTARVDLLFFKYALQREEVRVTDAGGLIAYQCESTENGRHRQVTGELRDGVFYFEITEAGQKRAWSTPRTAYDFDANSHPGQAPAAGEAIKYRVLDPAACSISERTYCGTGTEALTVGKRKITCHTLKIESRELHARRWFITDEHGALILREDGREQRGPYSRRAISLDLEQNAAE